MALTAADIIAGDNGAAVTLLDADHVTWSEDELLGYLNEALRATAFVKPDMYTVREFVTLVAGIEQALPAAGIALIAINRNANGRVISVVDRQLLDECNRFWPAGTQELTIEHYTADPREPRRFTVYPPSNGASSVEILYGAVPAALTDPDDEIPVPDSYQNALISFVLSKAYAKNSKKQDLTKSAAAMQDWARAVGAKSAAQAAVAPKVVAQPGVA